VPQHRIFSYACPEVRFTDIEYIDSSAQLWGVVFKEGEKYDKTLAESWKGDMDGILFFVRPSLSSPLCHIDERLDRRAFSPRLLQHSS